jgi:hypothetical protein
MRSLSGHLERAFADNLAFFQRQFEQKMASTVAAARAEVEAHVENVIRRTGLEQLRSEVPKLDGPKSEVADA